jgi:hypothetical protein
MHSNTTALPSRPDYFEGSFPRILDMHLNCPALDVVNTRRARGINAWLYRYAGDWPNEDLGTIRRPAWHGSGVSLVFGTTEKVFKVADVEKEKITSLKMRNAWSEFVKDPENGLLKLRWPLYNSKGMYGVKLGAYSKFCEEITSKLTLLTHLDPSLVLLGKTNSSEIAFARNQYYDAICSGSTKLDYATLLEHTSKYHSPSFDICLSPFLEYIRKFGEKEENLRNIPPEIINCKGDGKIYLV